MSAMSRTSGTSQPSNATSAEEPTTATTSPSEPTRVRSRPRARARVRQPVATTGHRQDVRWGTVSRNRTTRLSLPLAYPVKPASCPSTMLTATALTKPVMTALGTKRTIDPSRSRPSTSMTPPVSRPRVASAAAESSCPRTCGMSEITTAIAPVAWTHMNTELVDRAPATVPTR